MKSIVVVILLGVYRITYTTRAGREYGWVVFE